MSFHYPYPELKRIFGEDYEAEVVRGVACSICRAPKNQPCQSVSREPLDSDHLERGAKGAKRMLKRLLIRNDRQLAEFVEQMQKELTK